MKRICLISLLTLSALILSGCGRKGDDSAKVINLFIWEEYMDPDILAEFEAETGIRVVESNYASNEDLLAKLQVGGGGYDVIVPLDYMVQIMVKAGLLAPLDRAKLPNLSHLAARFASPEYDPTLAHSVPYLWGTTGIAYNEVEVPNPPTSWKEFMDPAVIGPHKGRISLLNDARETLSAALLSLGYPVNTTDPARINEARDVLLKIKPLVAKFDSESFEDSLAAGETVLAQAWSGDTAIAQDENESVKYLIPAEGSLMFVDAMAIPAKSKHVDEAHQLIDFLTRPEIAARIAEFTYYATPNKDALPLISEEIRAMAPFTVPEEATLFYLQDLGDDNELFNKAWMEIKAD